MNKSPADWSRVSVDDMEVVSSKRKVANVLRMALEDIAEMSLQVAEAFDRGFERGRQREMIDG
jgi:hypothetical protein